MVRLDCDWVSLQEHALHQVYCCLGEFCFGKVYVQLSPAPNFIAKLQPLFYHFWSVIKIPFPQSKKASVSKSTLFLLDCVLQKELCFPHVSFLAIDVNYKTLNGSQTTVYLDLHRMCCHWNCLLLWFATSSCYYVSFISSQMLNLFNPKIIHKKASE